jgi:hypothetical protein
MKKIFCLLIIILFQGCGYQPIYSSKNILIKIDKINYDYSKINRQIAKSLKTISNKDAQQSLNINLKSKKEKKTVSKNKSGDPEIFELAVFVEIKILDKQKTFVSKQNYKNIENKFELNQYEIEIEKQLISELINKILSHLTSFE